MKEVAAPRRYDLPPGRRHIRPGSYAIVYLLCLGVLVVSHLWLARLPYYWDEAGQFVPAALDILHGGSWIPHSTLPNIHPPAVMAYLAAAWRIGGFDPVTTRLAMLALSAVGLLAAFLLAIELTRETRGAPAFAAAAMLCVSPLFFAQSMMAQLDAPAMLFTTLALLLFVQDHLRSAATACAVLVLVKETGAVVPVVFAVWLLRERRWREAGWFAAPLLLLAGWIAILASRTGYWAGNTDFVQYNLWYPLHPARLVVTLFRRIGFLTLANFHWIGAVALAYAWRKARLFRSRSWRIAGAVLGAHVLLFTILGGAVLNRYLLPVLPILFAAFAAAFTLLPRVGRIVATVAVLAGLAVCNFVNPPYPFAYEENLAFTDFIKLHADAADYIAHWYGDPVVHSVWPMTAELSRPELGYVPRPIRVENLANFSPATLRALDWSKTQIVVVYSRSWDPRINPMRLDFIRQFWASFYDYVPNVTPEQARALIPFPAEQSFARRGQWVEIYVNPDLPRIPHQPARVATAN